MTVDGLISALRQGFGALSDHRSKNCRYALADTLMTGFAIFHQKDPSLLAFRDQFPARSANMKTIYGLEKIPEDTGLRECLDGVHPDLLLASFKSLFRAAQSENLLVKKQVLDKKLVVSFDGTGYFSSTQIHCDHCLTKERSAGSTCYHHPDIIGGAVVVAPRRQTVLPLYAEPIVNADGHTKNDCERNALKRLAPKVRQILDDQPVVAVLDALYADGPAIRAPDCIGETMDVIGIKEGYVLVQAERLKEQQKLEQTVITNKRLKKTLYWTRGLILNGSNQDIVVNFFGCEETDLSTGKTTYKNTWITNLEVSEELIFQMVEVAGSRWKIENETFNTLKNQGYCLEHNYGHGKKYLSTVFALLMLLAFAVDQLAQSADEAFKKAMKRFKTKAGFFRRAGAVFDVLLADSMNAIYRYIAGDIKINLPKLE